MEKDTDSPPKIRTRTVRLRDLKGPSGSPSSQRYSDDEDDSSMSSPSLLRSNRDSDSSSPSSSRALVLGIDEMAFDIGAVQVAPIVAKMTQEENGVELDYAPHGGHSHCFLGTSLSDWCRLYLLGWTMKQIDTFANFLLKKGIIIDVDGEADSFKARRYYYFARTTLVSSTSIKHAPKNDRKRLVVLGGGFAGASIAAHLQHNSDFEVTLIDNKEFFESTPQVLRLVTEPGINASVDIFKKIVIPHHKYLSKATVVKANVKEVTPDQKIVTDGGTFFFDYLVIATGSSYETNLLQTTDTQQQQSMVSSFRLKALAASALKIEKSNNIIIIGGGLVGTELTGELAQKYPMKKLTVIHAHDRLMERLDASVGKKALKWFEGRHVKVLFNERATAMTTKANGDGTESVTIKLASGTELQGDMVCWCTGQRANTSFLKKHFANHLDKNNRIKTNEFFQLEEFPNIFAAGDVTAWLEEKRGERAFHHAKLVMFHLMRDVAGKPPKTSYKPLKKPSPMVVSLGPKHGILVLNGKLGPDGRLPAKVKEAFFRFVLTVITRVGHISGPGRVHDQLFIPLPNVVAKEVHQQILVFGFEHKAAIIPFVMRSLQEAGVTGASLALPKDGKIKIAKKNDGEHHSKVSRQKDLTKTFNFKNYDATRPATLWSIIKEANVLVYLLDPPFSGDAKIFSGLATAAGSEKAECIILVYSHIALSIPDKFKEPKENFKSVMASVKKLFKRVIEVDFSGTFDWFVLLNPDIESTKVFTYPFEDKLLPWISQRDLVEALCFIACYPDRFARDKFVLSNVEPVSIEYLSECLAEIAGEDTEIVVPDKEEVIEMFEASALGKAATFLCESILASDPPLSNDLEMVLMRKPYTLRDWVQMNTHLFV